MTRTTTCRALMAAIYAPGAVRGYRPPSGWRARADLTDIHRFTGRALRRAVWWIIETN